MWSQDLIHTAPHLSRSASLLEALATEISSVFSELHNRGFPKVGRKDPPARAHNHFLGPCNSKSSDHRQLRRKAEEGTHHAPNLYSFPNGGRNGWHKGRDRGGCTLRDMQDFWPLEPALPPPFCVTFGKSLSLSGLCLPICKMKGIIAILSLPLGKTDKRGKHVISQGMHRHSSISISIMKRQELMDRVGRPY